MKRIIFSLILLMAPVSVIFTMAQSPVCGKSQQQKKTVFIPTARYINLSNTDGVSRIRFELEGIPHTSNRIDEVILYYQGNPEVATDIDGVDFKRYYQWEDDTLIPVDIDFPYHKTFSPNDSVSFVTVHGRFTTKLGAAAQRIR